MSNYIGTKEITKIYLGSTEIKKLYVGEEIVWDGGEPSPEYEQQWSNQQPEQHNTPVPIDPTSITSDITSITTKNVYEAALASESVGLETGLLSIVVEDL